MSLGKKTLVRSSENGVPVDTGYIQSKKQLAFSAPTNCYQESNWEADLQLQKNIGC